MQPIESYQQFLKAGRQNLSVDDLPFTVDEFENLIDSWVPMENISTILGVSGADLDRFCNKVYNLNFVETYNKLSGISDAMMRKAFSNLAKNGNATAIATVAKHFMKLEEDKQQNVCVTFVNDLKNDDEV